MLQIHQKIQNFLLFLVLQLLPREFLVLMLVLLEHSDFRVPQPILRNPSLTLVLEQSLRSLLEQLRELKVSKDLDLLQSFLDLQNLLRRDLQQLQYFIPFLVLHPQRSIISSEYLVLVQSDFLESLQPRNYLLHLFLVLELSEFLVKLFHQTSSLYQNQRQVERSRFLDLENKVLRRKLLVLDQYLLFPVASNPLPEKLMLDSEQFIFLVFLELQRIILIKFQDLTLSSFNLYHK